MNGAVTARKLGRAACVALAAALSPVMGGVSLLGAVEPAVRAWSRMGARSLGMRVRSRGSLPPPGSLVAANHVGYLDILAIGAVSPGRFLAKSEIAGWPLLGRLARWGGVLFVDRDRPRQILASIDEVAQRLLRGQRCILFPEAGVSPDGTTLGTFRPMLFDACVRAKRPVVPAAVKYVQPADAAVWAWIQEDNLWKHLWNRVLAEPRLEVEVRFGEPLWPRPGEGRKELAGRVRACVAASLEAPPGGG